MSDRSLVQSFLSTGLIQLVLPIINNSFWKACVTLCKIRDLLQKKNYFRADIHYL